MRLFIGLDLPDDIKERLAGMSGGLPGARWVPPENMHLTLRFIGEVDNAQARDLDDALSAVDGKGFDLTLKGIGSFGEANRLRALWAGVEPSEPLNRLQAKVEQAAVRAGLQVERRKFKPHVTLARFRADPPELKLSHYLSQHALFRAGPFPIQDFTLFSSFLGSEGALYEAEAVYPLERVAVPPERERL